MKSLLAWGLQSVTNRRKSIPVSRYTLEEESNLTLDMARTIQTLKGVYHDNKKSAPFEIIFSSVFTYRLRDY